jgi:chloramphenicol-sensitive protein RarD
MPDFFSGKQAGPRLGLAAALVAYLMWGVLPVYFKITASVPSLEMLAHRIVWAVPFGLLIILLRRQFADVRAVFQDSRTLGWLALAAICISLNWLVYIWAVQNDRIFQTSLGYYINPLAYVLIGVWFFGERLRRLQMIAVALASVGVLVLAMSGEEIPWVSLSLAVLFTAYGVIRKHVSIGAMPGLFVETLLLLPFAAGWLLYLVSAGRASFASGNQVMDAWLLLAGPITVLPLLFFATAARQLMLTTVGFMQFITPTLQFLFAVYYGEKLTAANLICFVFIWAAALVFSGDAIRSAQKKPPPVIPAGV